MKVKFIHVADARGKIGGAVASRNRFGSFFRSKTSPVNPQTSYQSTQRNDFTQHSQNWRGLTEAQQNSWNAAAVDFMKSNVFGDKVKLTGMQLYVRLNANIALVSGTPITEPPAPGSVTAIDSLVVDPDVSDATIVNTISPASPATQTYIVYATPPVSAGRRFVKNDLRKITTINNAAGTTNDITAAYEARFGTSWKVAGKVFYVAYKPVVDLSGLDGGMLLVRATVVA